MRRETAAVGGTGEAMAVERADSGGVYRSRGRRSATGICGSRSAICFSFFRILAKEHAAAVDALEGYQGTLVADAHAVYDHLYEDGTIIEAGCWSHVRRSCFFCRKQGLSPVNQRQQSHLGRHVGRPRTRSGQLRSILHPEQRLRRFARQGREQHHGCDATAIGYDEQSRPVCTVYEPVTSGVVTAAPSSSDPALCASSYADNASYRRATRRNYGSAARSTAGST
jgi:hypothetical protein